MKILSWSLHFFLLLAALPAYAKSVAEQQDAHVIEGLRDAGSDMSKPHDIDFFFYFIQHNNTIGSDMVRN